MAPLTDRATAIHEAGHAVSLMALGLTIDSVSIVPTEKYSGIANSPGLLGYYADTRPERAAIARSQVIHAYAGYEAEKRYNKNADPLYSQSDEEAAFDRLREYPPRNCRHIGDEAYKAALERLRRKARRLVKVHWLEIERLADVLMERGTLNRTEVVQIIGHIAPE